MRRCAQGQHPCTLLPILGTPMRCLECNRMCINMHSEHDARRLQSAAQAAAARARLCRQCHASCLSSCKVLLHTWCSEQDLANITSAVCTQGRSSCHSANCWLQISCLSCSQVGAIRHFVWRVEDCSATGEGARWWHVACCGTVICCQGCITTQLASILQSAPCTPCALRDI